MLLGDENTEDAGPITAGDIALVAGGALPLFVPLELLGMGEAGVIAGIAGGLLAFVYGKKIKQFAYEHAPAFQSPEELKSGCSHALVKW
jgi:membrane protein DedA with SNARE-associated domain